MRFKVSGCYHGRDKFSFRVEGHGERFNVTGKDWNRQLASRALNYLELIGYTRANIRFDVL